MEIHEILILLKAHIKFVFDDNGIFPYVNNKRYGICHVIRHLYLEKLINVSEENMISQYLRRNTTPFFGWGSSFEDFAFEPGKIKPRLKWLDEHIELTH